MKKKYKVKFDFEWGAGCLWPGNDACRENFGYGPYDDDSNELNLSIGLIERCRELLNWHYNSINLEYPINPGLWRQDECDRFNTACRELFLMIKEELGVMFDLDYAQDDILEDPSLDLYLEKQKGPSLKEGL